MIIYHNSYFIHYYVLTLFLFYAIIVFKESNAKFSGEGDRRALASRPPESAATFVRLLFTSFLPVTKFLTYPLLNIGFYFTYFPVSIYLPVPKFHVLFYFFSISVYFYIIPSINTLPAPKFYILLYSFHNINLFICF